METEYVAASPSGLFWLERNFSRKWQTFREETFGELEIEPHKLHATRHSFVTWALEAGQPIATVAA